MALYQLQSGSSVLISVASSSTLDEGGRRPIRRGTVFHTLAGEMVVQYLESAATQDIPVTWRIPRADRNQRGILQSVGGGAFGNVLTLVSPDIGSFQVAVSPGPNAYREKRLEPFFGYEISMEFMALS